MVNTIARRLRWLRYARITLVAFLSIVSCFACSSAKYREAQDLRRAIDNFIPVGSSKKDVAAFLQAEGIENSYEIDESPDKTIYAIIRDVSGIFITRSLAMEFEFDDTGSLTTHEVREVATGP